ncbi:MAG: hypothetical protein J6L85_01695 [Clostridia bacterium]|nr:hypothetical protein [Clostridia bacterium]
MKTPMPKIIGNQSLKQRLCNDILSGSLSHAYIIEGANGSGRHTIAMMTAAALACEAKNDISSPIPCLECNSCRKILEGKSPDVITVGTGDKASVRVDVARFIKEDVWILPNDLEDKIYIIEDGDKMTDQAQNAILLTLEEPPSFVHFFILCANAGSLLETIRSRAPILRTEPIDSALIDEYICSHDRRASQMKITSPKEYQELLLTANGGIGKALNLLEPKAWKPIHDLRLLVSGFVDVAINVRGAREIIARLTKFSSKRDVLERELALLSDAVRDLIVLKKCDNAPLTFYSDRNEAIELCDRTTLSFLCKLHSAVSIAIDENQRNANVRLMMTKMAVSADLF